MKILIVAPKFDIFPVGLAYIASSLKQAGHEALLYVFTNEQKMLAELSKANFDFVATGGLSSQYLDIKKILFTARKSGIKTIAGGGIITSEPELMLRALCPDFGVIGEGEETIVEFLQAFEMGRELSAVKGICYIDNDKFVVTENRKQLEELDTLPWPDYDGFGYSQFLDSMKSSDSYSYDLFDYPREYPVITSRSCPFQCTFCYHPSGDKYRQRSMDSIMDELMTVIPKYKINIVAIYDELFSFDEARVYEFCEKFRKFTDSLDWDVRWSCQMRVAGLKDSMLDAMKAAGCYLVSYGFESYNAEVLNSMKKHITPEQIHNAVHATIDRNISIQANFIFGDPKETWATALQTLTFWKEHIEAGILLSFILAFPDSPIYQFCQKKGLINNKLHYIEHDLYKVLNMTAMSDHEFSKLTVMVQKHTLKYCNYVVPFDRTSSSVSAVCPHCNVSIQYNNYYTSNYRYTRMMYCRSCRKRFFIANRLSMVIMKVKYFLLSPLFMKLYERVQKPMAFIKKQIFKFIPLSDR
ncbi:MAG: cobalamin B12-binding domain-containing protein [Geobacteraceae bacterium]|nr:cobalamin B12-binding domain-containing protein [Geobacteraceae bacterium]